MKSKIYFKNLEGLRFCCFLSVFFFHSFKSFHEDILNSKIYHFVKFDIFQNGNLGVNFFFVLSGFLITYLLIQEKKLTGYIHIRDFWVRRILRIWPLFFLCVLIGFYGFPWLKMLIGKDSNESASILYYITFLNNFDFINKGHPESRILAVLWSLAVEEQFYFIWPVFLYFLPLEKYWIAFSLVVLTSIAFRSIYDIPDMHEYHSLSCMGDIAMGALGAWLISEKSFFKKIIENMSKIYIVLIYILFLSIFFLRDEFLYNTYIIRIFERVFIAGVILLIILEQNYARNSLFKFSNYQVFSRLGRISFGLYCFHYIGIIITTTITDMLGFNKYLWQVMILESSVALLLSIVISILSYRFLEGPFLRLKDKFSYFYRESEKQKFYPPIIKLE